MTVYLICMDFLVPLIFLGIGFLWEKHPPRKINGVYGYRTRRSFSSQEAWDYAHAYSAKLDIRYGVISALATAAVISAGAAIASYDLWIDVLGYLPLVQAATLFIPIVMTEAELRRRFDGEGRPKDR